MVEAMWWYDGRLCFVCVLCCVCAICGGDGLTRRHIGWGGETRAQQRSSSSAAADVCVMTRGGLGGCGQGRRRACLCVAAVLEVRSARRAEREVVLALERYAHG